ncbi:vWA domain-containing protein [Adhaeribacter rhizoryzae]|uniref:VWA domain-containing protein n=1 Tax=Adhaeribacter rhizoryzae TaxID=2607907 RepID=A0A5M6D015_9BACT|nr:VWA domain-containing protein [Adhaeribacter rhizoryzae]KAA5540804.1 VWA domain-containing protein [Adhaeribacter rhizoryzae]
MNWYQSLSWLEILFGTLFLLLYGSYAYRIKRLAQYFKQGPQWLWIKFIIRSVYMLLLLIAVLGPSFGAMKKEIKTVGKDIFLLVDLSASMNVRDVAPSRLEKIKYELTQAVPAFNADRVGLILFTSEALVQCPLTFDLEALLLYTRLLNTNQASATGTNYEPALQLALQKFEANPDSGNISPKARLITLISDGENFGEDVRVTLQRLRNQQIKVFTLGIGTETGDFVPEGQNFKKDRNGQQVTSRLNDEPLREIARRTNGSYFEITNDKNEMDELVRAVNLVEGETQEAKTIDITANKYMYPLFLALILIVADVLITVNVIKI